MASRKAISTEIKLRLFSDSAGYCQNPDCLQPLYPAEMGGEKHIAEMAHVIPHGEKGPRHEDRPAEEFEADSFENLILLCPKCHTVIDKAPDGFSRSTLLGWKNRHLLELAHSQGIQTYEDRNQARAAVAEAMAENKAIWKEYAPVDGDGFDYNPESEAAKTWENRMRGVILPNHFRIEAIIKKNLCHMSPDERDTFARYQEHVRGLSARHICGVAGEAIRYPAAMDEIFS
jgi:hypothetical protein